MPAALNAKYDHVAPGWADKMRVLGYYDGYLGFLSANGYRAGPGHRVIDIGAGTGAFAEAWVAIHGPDQDLTLLEPSTKMAACAAERLAARGVAPEILPKTLEAYDPVHPFDTVLAAHVIEHGDAPQMLAAMRHLVRPGAQLWLVASKPHWCNAIIWLQWRLRTYRPDTLCAMLNRAGWALQRRHSFSAGPPSRTSHGYMCRAI